VYFDPSAEMVVIDRSVSTCMPGIATFDESAPHTLFTFARPEKDDASKVILSREELCFHCYFDHGLVEVFVNERTVITTRVYPSTATCLKIEPFIFPHTTIQVADDSFSSGLISFDLWPLEL
jgi:beta-fructofuranosidase